MDTEDRKLVVLARSTRVRTGAAEGAALRDQDGRTYAGATVALPSLQVSAVGVCLAMAISGGSTGVESVVVLTEAAQPAAADLDALRDFAGPGVTVHVGDPSGTIRAEVTA